MLCNRRKIDFNIIAEISARRAPRRHSLCKAVAVAIADEFARDARVYAVVDYSALLIHSRAGRGLVSGYGVN